MSYYSVLWIPIRPDPGLFDQVGLGSGIILPDPDLTVREENLYVFYKFFYRWLISSLITYIFH
jgi:hypothetical protein